MNWKQVKEIIEEDLNIDLSDVRRSRAQTEARSVYYGVCYNKLKMLLSEIGDTVDKDHTTVSYGIRKVLPSLAYYNKGLYKYYLDLCGIDNKVFEINKRVAELNRNQLELISKVIDEFTK